MESDFSLKNIIETLAFATANSKEVYWIADATGQCIYYLSPAFEKVWGYPRSGRPFNIVWVDENTSITFITQLSETIRTEFCCNQPMLLYASNSGQFNLPKPEIFFAYLNYQLPVKIMLFELAHAWDKWKTSRVQLEVKPIAGMEKPKILLVEDDPVVRRVHEAMLKKANCVTVSAIDGKQALVMYHDNYDLIFMDVGLPEISGLEVTKEIRRRELGNKHTPIIALTGYAYEEDRENCLAAGCDEIVTKPIKFDKLLQILQRWRQF